MPVASSGSSYAEYGPFSGTTKDGIRHGRGKFTYRNQYFSYDGAWKAGVSHGSGTLHMADGSSYEGSFVDGEICGAGLRRWPDGSSYSGQFDMGELHGQGMYISATGETYEGAYGRNCRHGDGVLRLANGDRCEGAFAAHRMSGHGSKWSANGDFYRGEFSCDERSGQGSMQWADGATHEGGWAKDEPDSAGVYRTADGFCWRGEWIDGAPSQPVSVLAPSSYVEHPAELLVRTLRASACDIGIAEGERVYLSVKLGGEGLTGVGEQTADTEGSGALEDDGSIVWGDSLTLQLPEGSQRPPSLIIELYKDEQLIISTSTLLRARVPPKGELPSEVQLSVPRKTGDDSPPVVFSLTYLLTPIYPDDGEVAAAADEEGASAEAPTVSPSSAGAAIPEGAPTGAPAMVEEGNEVAIEVNMPQPR